MPDCPTCAVPLRTVRQRDGIYFGCDQCGGRAVTFPQVRRFAGDRFVTALLRQINRSAVASDRTCPFCSGTMRHFAHSEPPIQLDACRPCGMVWFDAGEFEAIPEGASESMDALIMRGLEAPALEKVKQIAEEARADDDLPEEGWKWAAGAIGMPVQLDEIEAACHPWLTWSISALILLLSGLAFLNLESVVDHFGFVPAHAWRYAGLTWISSFFLHGGIWHLVSNLYFFLVFGYNVEGFLRHWKFAVLVLASTLGGDLLALMLDPRSDVPSIGASGGISGVLAFYALQFPQARLGMWVRFGWFAIPAWALFALWVILQIVTAVQQVWGMTQISGLAHLGGALVGLGAWLKWGDSMRRSKENAA